MARTKKRRPQKKSNGRRKRARKYGYAAIAFERIKSLIITITLLATGALIGSWWIEWRDTEGGDQPAIAQAAPVTEHRLKVEVLNGSGERGAAGAVGDVLIDLGYDVVMVDNADHFDHETSHVLDRSGIGAPVTELGRQLGTDSVAVQVDADLLLDATVILGKDWRTLVRDR